jgi:Fungal Zn(2)-Cys(6) binuclear cluster domain
MSIGIPTWESNPKNRNQSSIMSLDGPSLRAACDRCHKRKQRCMRPSTSDDNIPCRRCKEAGEQCVYSPPCRLGRPSNKSKQQRWRPCNEYPPQEDSNSINSSPIPVESSVTSFKSDGLENRKNTYGPQTRVTGQKSRMRQPGRPRRSRNSRSTPPLVDSPKSTTSVPNVSEDNVSSVASMKSSVASPNVFTGHLQQAQSIQTEDQHQHIDFPTATMSSGLFFSAPDSHPVIAQTIEVDPGNRMWHTPTEPTFRMENDHSPNGTLHYHQQITSHDMISAHSSLQHQSQKFVARSEDGQVVDPITPTSDGNNSIWSNTSMNMQHSQHFGRTSLAKPLTPPPLLPTGKAGCVEDNTNVYMQPGYIYMPVDNYNPGDPWFADANEPYYAANDKSAEDPIITTTTLIQNYHLQMQLMPTTNLEIRQGEGNWLRYPIYQ